jgi:hypothetical protein
MRNTKKRVEAEKMLKKLGQRFKTNAQNVVLYEKLNELEYRWSSELGAWETFEDWFSRKKPVNPGAKVRVIAEPEDLYQVVMATAYGLEENGWSVVEQSAPYSSGNHPKYKGQTVQRVYIRAVKL